MVIIQKKYYIMLLLNVGTLLYGMDRCFIGEQKNHIGPCTQIIMYADDKIKVWIEGITNKNRTLSHMNNQIPSNEFIKNNDLQTKNYQQSKL